MPFNTDTAFNVVVINTLCNVYPNLSRDEVKARLYVYVLTRAAVINFLNRHGEHYRLPMSFHELREDRPSLTNFVEYIYNHLEIAEHERGPTTPRLSEIVNNVLSTLERELRGGLSGPSQHLIQTYMRSNGAHTLPSTLFRPDAIPATPTLDNNFGIIPQSWTVSIPTEESNVSVRQLEDVTDSSEATTEQGMRRRGTGDGLDSPLHNARLLYSSCYGLYKDKIVYVSNFDGEAKPKARVHELQNHSPAEAYASVPMDAVKLGFNFEYGWVHLPNRNLFAYTAYIPGNFLKGASRKNTRVLGSIMADDPLSPFIPHDYIRPEHIESLLDRKFTSFEEGINSKKEIFIVSPHVLVCSQVAKEKTQKKVYFNTTVVGVLNEKYKYVKLYKKFINLLPLFRTVIPYEIR